MLPPSFPALRRKIRVSRTGAVVERKRPGAPIVAKIMKRTVDALKAHADDDVFAWDPELRGSGVRVKPSGVRTSRTVTERQDRFAAGSRFARNVTHHILSPNEIHARGRFKDRPI